MEVFGFTSTTEELASAIWKTLERVIHPEALERLNGLSPRALSDSLSEPTLLLLSTVNSRPALGRTIAGTPRRCASCGGSFQYAQLNGSMYSLYGTTTRIIPVQQIITCRFCASFFPSQLTEGGVGIIRLSDRSCSAPETDTGHGKRTRSVPSVPLTPPDESGSSSS
jgi:hypothetical protein